MMLVIIILTLSVQRWAVIDGIGVWIFFFLNVQIIVLFFFLLKEIKKFLFFWFFFFFFMLAAVKIMMIEICREVFEKSHVHVFQLGRFV